LQNMSSDMPSSAAASATTSGREPRRDEHPSESEFLRREAEDARLAILETFDRLKSDVVPLIDVTAWTREYPLPAVGSAALAGFLAAQWIVSAPDSEDGLSEERRNAIDERIAELRAKRDASEEPGPEPAEGHGAFGALLSPILKIATGAAMGAIRDAFASLGGGSHENGAS
jgi:hypothetical protein